MKVKPSLPSGTRDFLPQEVVKRNYIFNTIKMVLDKYGFQEIETPVLENLTTLTGKYGEEGDQLLFKVLNSGDFLKDADAQSLINKDNRAVVTKIGERGLPVLQNEMRPSTTLKLFSFMLRALSYSLTFAYLHNKILCKKEANLRLMLLLPSLIYLIQYMLWDLEAG